MLPVSLVDNSAFREYINYLDPSFSIPSRKTIKDSSLPKLKECIENKIKMIMSNKNIQMYALIYGLIQLHGPSMVLFFKVLIMTGN